MNTNEEFLSGHEPSQNTKILNALKAGIKLTPTDALSLFGCFRLASRIHDLIKAGHVIEKERIRTASGKIVQSYFMKK